MGTFAAGQVIVLPFPFSDLSRGKYRPDSLLSDAGRGDWIACQITSNPYADSRAVETSSGDFITGGLQRTSYAHPAKLFTASETHFCARSQPPGWECGLGSSSFPRPSKLELARLGSQAGAWEPAQTG